MPNSKLE